MCKHTDSAAVGRIKPWEAVINKGVKTGLVLPWLVVGIFGWLVSWLVPPTPEKKRNHETNKRIWPFVSCVPQVISSENRERFFWWWTLIVAACQHCLPREWKLHWGHLFPSWGFWWCSLWIPAAAWPCMSFKARLRFCVSHYFSLLLFPIWSSRTKFADWEPDPADADLSRINE